MFTRVIRASKRSILNRRLIHNVPELEKYDHFIKNGIEGLYTPSGFQKSWLDYQRYLTINLTFNTNGTENELKSPYQIILNTAKQTIEQHTFHFASQAHNNHFMFELLTDSSEAANTQPSRYLMGRLSDAGFNTLEEFRDAFLSIGELSTGPGWIFLVENADKSVKILKCNVDGTPYYYGKNQSIDLNGGIDEISFEKSNQIKQLASENQRDFTLPLLAISLWDVSFINDYGINGKRQYLQNVWDCIDWNVVNSRIFQL